MTLFDIFDWEISSKWVTWKISNIPPRLFPNYDMILSLLQGVALISIGVREAKDGDLLGSRRYTIKRRYEQLIQMLPLPPFSRVWG